MIQIRNACIPIALAAILSLATIGAAGAVENPAPADPSLLPVFKQFGGKPGLVAVVDDLMVNLLADPRTRPFFDGVDTDHVKAELVDQFCTILGGPCTYAGKDMKESHAKLGVRESNFNALVEDLQLAMDKHRIPFRAQNRLLEKLSSMHREIVTKP